MSKYGVILCLFFATLSAEIDQVQMTWDKLQCDKTCVSLLKKNLDKYPPIAAYKMDENKGIAYLRWIPDSPFDFLSMKRIYQSVGFGFGIGDIMVKARGTLERKGKDFVFKSIGDNTRFRISGQADPSKTRFSSTGSSQSYPLSNEQRTQLEQAYQQRLMVEITGGLMYSQYDLPMIMIKNLSFPNKL